MKLTKRLKKLGIASLILLNSYTSFGCNPNVSFQDTAQTPKQQEEYKNKEITKSANEKLEELVNTQTQQFTKTEQQTRMRQIPANILTVGEHGTYTSIVDALRHSLQGYEVWVSEGSYFESVPVLLKNNVRLLGGYSKDFSKRDPKQFPTIIDGNGVYRLSCVMLAGTSTIDGFTIQHCNSLDASAIELYQSNGNSGEFIISNNIIRNNQSGKRDGQSTETGEGSVAFYIFFDANTKVTLENNEIYGNAGGIGAGAFIVVDGGSDGRGLTAKLDALIKNNKIYSNVNQTSGGGLDVTIENKTQTNIIIENNNIERNQSGGGGGIHVGTGNPESQLNLVIENNEITGNKISGAGSGGGIIIDNRSDFLTATIKRNMINKNQAEFIGGGLSISSLSVNPPEVELSGNVISNNISGPWGGAMYTQGNINLNSNNNLVTYNTAVGNFMQDAAGGGFYIKDGGLTTLINNTFYGNKAIGQKPHGGGVYIHTTSPAVITNTIIKGNSLQGVVPGFGSDLYAGSSVVASHSNIGEVSSNDGKWGEPDGSYVSSNMANVDPQFVNLESFVLSDNSPMIDAGDTLILDTCVPSGKGTNRSDISYTGGNNCNIRIPVLKGDINGDGLVDLKDGIISLQVISGKQPLETRPDYKISGADVDGDNRIGQA